VKQRLAHSTRNAMKSIKSSKDSHYSLKQGSATYGPRAGSGQPNKIIRPVAFLQIVGSVCPPSGIIVYESALLPTFRSAYLWETALC